jgi:hypothetical protein
MSRTTDWVLDQEDRGNIYYDGEKYVRDVEVQLTNHIPDIYEEFERAEFELQLAFNRWQEIRDTINNSNI